MFISMRAAIISIGDEIVLGQALDSNSAWISDQLIAHSIQTIEHCTVADDRAQIAQAIKRLAEKVDVLLLTGGLGPTDDDLTREAMGEAIWPGKPLIGDPSAVTRLEKWFSKYGSKMPRSNLKQALRTETASFLDNPNGTALGLADKLGDCQIFAMPGPPSEMKPMFIDHVLPSIASIDEDQSLLTMTVHSYGLGESVAAQRLGELTDRNRKPLVGTTVSGSMLAARIIAHGNKDQAQRELNETALLVEQSWEPYTFGRDEDTLSSSVGDLLRKVGKTVTTAESCTGGLLGKMIVDVSGSSSYYRGGWITYTNELKMDCLEVPLEILDSNGAVSKQTASAMAKGALKKAGADYSLAITGIAGPEGGSKEKPVGLVYIAIAQQTENDEPVIVRGFRFTGDRGMIRDRAAKSALQMLRFVMMNVNPMTALIWQLTDECD